MNKEEIYKFLLNNEVHKYSLLNEIYAIRDKRFENVDYTISVNGCISVDVLNKNIALITDNDKLQSQLDIANKKLEEIKKYINKNIRHEYRNGRNNEFYLELNENKLKQLQSIIGGE